MADKKWQISKLPLVGASRSTLSRLVSVFPLYSTDLNSPSEPVDIGRDPSFSFYIGPAAILRVNSVLATLLDGLRQARHKTKTGIVRSRFKFTSRDVPVKLGVVHLPWGERGWCSMWMWSWSFSEGLQWSPQWCMLSWPCALGGSAPSSEALGSFWSTGVWKWGSLLG